MATNSETAPLQILEGVSAPSPMPEPALRVDVAETMDEQHFEVLWREQTIRERNAKIKRLQDEHEMRRKYLPTIFIFVALFILASMSVSIFADLSDAVAIALLTNTTAQVIGVLAIALRWLYPLGGNPPD